MFYILLALFLFRVGVKFDPGNAELIRQVAHIPVLNNILYQESPGRWIPAPYGPLDTRLVCIWPFFKRTSPFRAQPLRQTIVRHVGKTQPIV